MTQISGPVLPTKIFAESKVLKKGDQQIPTDLHMTHTGRCNVYMARVNWNSRFSVMAVQNPTPAALVRSRAWEHPLIFPVLFQAVIWNPYCAGGGKSLHGPEVWESIAMLTSTTWWSNQRFSKDAWCVLKKKHGFHGWLVPPHIA